MWITFRGAGEREEGCRMQQPSNEGERWERKFCIR
mgnify:CR=1|jgi:hypothetical protein